MTEEHDHGASLGDCQGCRDMWMKQVGGKRGLCMVCDHRHWPWERHESGVYDPPPPDRDPGTATCLLCGEPIEVDDRTAAGFTFRDDSIQVEAMHIECQALPIVGHTFGVCLCTGFGTDRAAAKELARRLASGASYVDGVIVDDVAGAARGGAS